MSDIDVKQFRRLMALREARDLAKKAADAAEEEYREAEADAFEALEDSPHAGTVKLDLGEPYGVVSFLPRTTVYGRIIDQDAALEHYENRAMVEEITVPKFSGKRINEEVRNHREQGLPMPPGVTYYERRNVTITKQKD